VLSRSFFADFGLSRAIIRCQSFLRFRERASHLVIADILKS
jgi:hypothetical protein